MSCRVVCSSVSKTRMELSGQNATEAEGKSSAQCLQHPGLQLATCEKPRPVSYFRKVLFMCVLDLCLIL